MTLTNPNPNPSSNLSRNPLAVPSRRRWLPPRSRLGMLGQHQCLRFDADRSGGGAPPVTSAYPIPLQSLLCNLPSISPASPRHLSTAPDLIWQELISVQEALSYQTNAFDTYVSEQNEQKLSAGEDEEKISLATTIAVGFMGLLLGALLGVAGNTLFGCKGKGLKKGLGLRPARASIDGSAPSPNEKMSARLRDEEAGVTLNKGSFKAEPTV